MTDPNRTTNTDQATNTGGPLAGLTIVDLTRVLAGPYCTMVLADLGARVIKIENPKGGDDTRSIGPFVGKESAYFASVNRGKQSLALNLKDPDHRSIFEALLARADVVIENFRPGVMARLGYGWETLHAQHPHLIYAAASGFGQTGPEAHRAAYDMVVQAMGGIMSVTGHVGGPPTRVGTSIGDITAGLFTTIGILAALNHRTKSGQGQFVDVAMLDGQIAILENAVARTTTTGVAPGPLGARHPSITPFAAYQCADGPIVIAAGNDGLWHDLLDALGLSALKTNPRFASNALRTDAADEIATILEAALATAPAAHWLETLDKAGVPSGPLQDVKQALAHPQIQARNMLIDTALADGTPFKAAGNPVKLSAHPDPTTRPRAPRLDEHRAEILKELGL